MATRWTALCLCVVLLFSATGCAASFRTGELLANQLFPTTTTTQTAETVPTAAAVNPYEAEYAGGFYYQKLSAQQQQNYGAVYQALRDGAADNNAAMVSLPCPLGNRSDAQVLFYALQYDCPQFFYLSLSDCLKTRTSYYDLLTIKLTVSSVQRAAMTAALNARVAELTADIPADASDFDKALLLHDRLVSSCVYNRDVADLLKDENGVDNEKLYQMEFDHPNIHSAYGALVDGDAVCDGYAYGYALLLHAVGLPCGMVTGYSRNVNGHAWNYVCLDGQWYHTDVTWDDYEDGEPLHTYLNLNVQEICLTHTITSEMVDVVDSMATDANYYRHKGLYLEAADRDTVAATIAAQIAQGNPAAELRFGSSDDYADAVAYIHDPNTFYYDVNAYLSDSSYSMWRSYVLVEERRDLVLLVMEND